MEVQSGEIWMGGNNKRNLRKGEQKFKLSGPRAQQSKTSKSKLCNNIGSCFNHEYGQTVRIRMPALRTSCVITNSLKFLLLIFTIILLYSVIVIAIATIYFYWTDNVITNNFIRTSHATKSLACDWSYSTRCARKYQGGFTLLKINIIIRKIEKWV